MQSSTGRVVPSSKTSEKEPTKLENIFEKYISDKALIYKYTHYSISIFLNDRRY